MGSIVQALLCLLVVLSLPWVVFMAMKLGTYAFFKGRALFQQEQEKSNGKPKS